MRKIVLLILFVSNICLPFSRLSAQSSDFPEDLLSPVSEHSEEVDQLLEQGMEFLYTEPEESHQYFQQAKDLAEASDDRKLMAKVYQHLSIYCWARGEFIKALEYDRRTLSLYQTLDDRSGVAYSLNSLGVSLSDVGMYHEALKYLFEAEDLFLQLGDSTALNMVYMNIGTMFSSLGDDDAALDFYRKSLSLGLRLRVWNSVAGIYNNMAEISLSREVYQEAYDYYSKAFKIYEKEEDIAGTTLVKGNLANYYSITDNYAVAETLFGQALEGYLSMSDKHGESDMNLGLGKLHRLMKAYRKSEEYLDIALQIAQNHQYLDLLIKAQYQLALLKYEQNKFEEAHSHFLKYDAAKDSLHRESSNKEFDNLRMVYEAEEKEHQLQALEAQNEVKEIISDQKDRLRNALLAIAILLLLFSLTGTVLYRRLKSVNLKLETHQESLKLKNKEIEETAEQLKTANAQLLNEKKLAEISSEAKAEFVSVLSHEIRTPLNAIIGISHALKEDIDDDDQHEYLGALIHSANTLLGFTNNILDLSRLDAGKLELSEENISLKTLIEQIIRTFEPALKQNDLNLNTTFGANVPETIKGDKMRFTQIILNLISNSVKYTEKGGIEVIINNSKLDEESVLLQIEVKDTGIGISEDLQPKIFDRYSRLQYESTLTPQGSGLGLSITRSLIKLLGGTIEFESTPNIGTSFTVLLPFKLSSKQTVEDEARLKAQKAALNGHYLKGKSLLLVEDNEVNVMFTERLLKKLGTTVEVARDGEEAVAKAGITNFDLILMDLQMPKMNGIDAATMILKGQPNARIIALTANTDDHIKLKLETAGFKDLLIKPFNPDELGDKIGHWIYS